jgi:hypothetical protein
MREIKSICNNAVLFAVSDVKAENKVSPASFVAI